MSGDNGYFKPWGEKERQIYRFHDGTRPRAVDPVVCLEALERFPGLALEADLALAEGVGLGGPYAEEGQKALARLVEATRAVFAIPPVDAGGLTRDEALNLFVDFGNYMGRLADAARPLPGSPPPTDPPGSAASTTPPSSASTSTAASP